jgi:hypothetical protein
MRRNHAGPPGHNEVRRPESDSHGPTGYHDSISIGGGRHAPERHSLSNSCNRPRARRCCTPGVGGEGRLQGSSVRRQACPAARTSPTPCRLLFPGCRLSRKTHAQAPSGHRPVRSCRHEACLVGGRRGHQQADAALRARRESLQEGRPGGLREGAGGSCRGPGS